MVKWDECWHLADVAGPAAGVARGCELPHPDSLHPTSRPLLSPHLAPRLQVTSLPLLLWGDVRGLKCSLVWRTGHPYRSYRRIGESLRKAFVSQNGSVRAELNFAAVADDCLGFAAFPATRSFSLALPSPLSPLFVLHLASSHSRTCCVTLVSSKWPDLIRVKSASKETPMKVRLCSIEFINALDFTL